MIAIAVVVTVYTAGAAASYFATGTALSGSAAMGAGVAAMGGSLGAAGIAGAAVGGFVGSAVSQLAGQTMGVVDHFSLKNALVSGGTAGLTAGAGSALQGMGWATAGLEAGEKLNILGRAAMAGAGVMANAGANKLVGNPSGFRWRNVATAMGTSLVGDALGLSDSKSSIGRFTSGNIATDMVGGIARAGISYGLDRLQGGTSSWNFRNVAQDAFGNALGNDIVRRMMPTAQEVAKTRAESNKKTADTVYTSAISVGKSPKEATLLAAQAVAEQSGGAVSLSDSAGNARSNRNGTVPFNSADGFRMSNGQDSAVFNFANDGIEATTLIELASFMSEAPIADIGYKVGYDQVQRHISAERSYQEGIFRGERNTRIGREQSVLAQGGFHGDRMTQQQWGYAIAAQTQQWSYQDQASAMGLVAGLASIPTLVGGGGLVAFGAGMMIRGGLQFGARALGEFALESMAYGFRSTAVNVVQRNSYKLAGFGMNTLAAAADIAAPGAAYAVPIGGGLYAAYNKVDDVSNALLRMDSTSRYESLFKGLGDASSSPWLADNRVGVRNHIEMFREGGSFLIPKSSFDRFFDGQKLIGDPAGQFITNKSTMDNILSEANGSLSFVKTKLGIDQKYWNEEMLRIDIHNPLLHNARLPSGLERGANEQFIWGGYTSGGQPELVIDQLPLEVLIDSLRLDEMTMYTTGLR